MSTKRRRYLRHDQLHALANESGRYRVLVLTRGYCGLRWGEATALRTYSVELERDRLNITDAVSEINRELIFGTRKSHQSRWLPVPASPLAELGHEMKGKGPDDLVFGSPQGAVMRVDNFSVATSIGPRRRLGSPAWSRTKLRHTAASLAIVSGATVKSVNGCWGTPPRR